MSAARWSKEPRETGLRAITQGERGFHLKKDGEIIARVQPLTGPNSRWDVVGWFWYGFGNNTCHTPVSTPEEAKAQAMAAYKASGS